MAPENQTADHPANVSENLGPPLTSISWEGTSPLDIENSGHLQNRGKENLQNRKVLWVEGSASARRPRWLAYPSRKNRTKRIIREGAKLFFQIVFLLSQKTINKRTEELGLRGPRTPFRVTRRMSAWRGYQLESHVYFYTTLRLRLVRPRPPLSKGYHSSWYRQPYPKSVHGTRPRLTFLRGEGAPPRVPQPPPSARTAAGILIVIGRLDYILNFPNYSLPETMRKYDGSGWASQ
jgi:hypothetical protein